MEVSIDARTRTVALLGDPVEHSLSPLIHNTAFRAQGLNFAYVALRVAEKHIEEAVRGLRALNFVGANVTAPHKQAVIPVLDELSEQAAAIRAVNTITVRGDRLSGDNTDVEGFLAPLKMEEGLRNAPMVVLGSGGAARAVVYGLLIRFRPEKLTLVARTPSRAEQLASELAGFDDSDVLRVQSMSGAGPAVRAAKLVINATPVGTYPNHDRSPWTNPDDIAPHQLIYDLVYNPRQTALLKMAASRGARTIGGLEMLISQAALSYATWTGREMPVAAVRETIQQHLSA